MNNFKTDHFDYTVIKRLKVSVYIFIVIVIHGHHLQLWFTGHKTLDIKIYSPYISFIYNFVARLLNIYLTCLCMYFWLCTKHCQQFFFSAYYIVIFQGSLVKDFFTSLCCEPCAVCQMNRELDQIGMWFWISSTVIFHLSYM